MRERLSESRLANLGAREISAAFEAYCAGFRTVTRRARSRFEERDWIGLRDDSAERLDLYRMAVEPTVARILALLEERVHDRITWAGMKAVYSGLMESRDDCDLAETFFNSITRRIFATVGVDRAIEFVDSDFFGPPPQARLQIYRTYTMEGSAGSLDELFERILRDSAHAAPYADLCGDATRLADTVRRRLHGCELERVEILTPIFYRNKGAYLIGRLWVDGQLVPLAIALLHRPAGIVVDALLLDENDLSIVFSFAHSYFLVDSPRPHDLVVFLQSLVPRKRVAELWISLGYHKHGKTELYRDLLESLEASSEQFETAPGERGMVMLVFTLPGYDLVVKVIRDRFADPKTTTRREVMSKYRLVFRHDRAGRLVDAQEFEHLQFARARFAPELLDELVAEAAQTVTVEGDRVVIHHAYIERRVIPLDLYLRHAESSAALAAAIDLGRAIKDLAASNIFAGDFLLKNFGVTRHRRVVSYDYDELELITDLRFSRMPQPVDDAQALAAEPWFHVADNDVYPEEFRTYLRLPRGLNAAFAAEHADLFEPDFWTETQARLRAGEVLDVFAYSMDRRMSPALVSA